MNQKERSKICFECGGLCCKSQIVTCMKTDYNAKEFYDTTKTPLKVIELSDRWIYLMHMPAHCQAEDGSCTIYDQKRPAVCELFPEYEISNLLKLFCPLAKRLAKDKAGVMRHF